MDVWCKRGSCYAHTHAHTLMNLATQVCVQTRTHACIHKYMHPCIQYACMRTHIHTCLQVRGWVHRKGFTAPQCAGVIHTDFEAGFICAEVLSLSLSLSLSVYTGTRARARTHIAVVSCLQCVPWRCPVRGRLRLFLQRVLFLQRLVCEDVHVH